MTEKDDLQKVRDSLPIICKDLQHLVNGGKGKLEYWKEMLEGPLASETTIPGLINIYSALCKLHSADDDLDTNVGLTGTVAKIDEMLQNPRLSTLFEQNIHRAWQALDRAIDNTYDANKNLVDLLNNYTALRKLWNADFTQHSSGHNGLLKLLEEFTSHWKTVPDNQSRALSAVEAAITAVKTAQRTVKEAEDAINTAIDKPDEIPEPYETSKKSHLLPWRRGNKAHP